MTYKGAAKIRALSARSHAYLAHWRTGLAPCAQAVPSAS